MQKNSSKNVNVLLLGPSAGVGSFLGPESRTGFSKDRFAVPPLGIWRISGYLINNKFASVEVWDGYIDSEEYLVSRLKEKKFDIIGFSITHQTLENDIYFMHACKKFSPSSTLVIGGDEATFNYVKVMDIAPIDYTVLGEGEKPMAEMCMKIKNGITDFTDIPGLIYKSDSDYKKTGEKSCEYKRTGPNYAMDHKMFSEATVSMDWKVIPYERYWDQIESFYEKPNLNETRTIRIFTTNYCPFDCLFCSSTNFLNAAGGSQNKKRANVAGLTPEQIMTVLNEVLEAHPKTRNIFINDDDFVLQAVRVQKFCDLVCEAKEKNVLPNYLTFMCLSRIDDIEDDTLAKMKAANFKMIGYGVENFSQNMLNDLNKRIKVEQIDRTVTSTLAHGITPFMNIIIMPPTAKLVDVFITIERCLDYIEQGFEVAVEPYFIPMAGAISTHQGYEMLTDKIPIEGTDKVLVQETVILPEDEEVKKIVLGFKNHYYKCLEEITYRYNLHFHPARLRSLVSFYTIYSFLGEKYQNELERVDNIIKNLYVPAHGGFIKDKKEYDWLGATG